MGTVETKVRAALDRGRSAVAHEADRHRDGHEVRLAGYASAAGMYSAGVVALAVTARRLRRPVPVLGVADVAMLALATNRMARVVSREPIASPLRAPFTRATGELVGPAQLAETPRGSGLRAVIGELLTCPFCVSQWVASTMAGALVMAPRTGQFAVRVLASLGVADFLQFGWAKAEQATH